MPVVRVVTLLALCLWLGGLVMLFIAVSTIFNHFAPDRAAAGQVAAAIFNRVEPVQLVLAGVLVAASLFVWWRTKHFLRGLFAGFVLLAAVLAVAGHFGVSARLEDLREAGMTTSPEFRRLHGISMLLYVSQTASLFIGAVCVALASGANARNLPHPTRQSAG